MTAVVSTHGGLDMRSETCGADSGEGAKRSGPKVEAKGVTQRRQKGAAHFGVVNRLLASTDRIDLCT